VANVAVRATHGTRAQEPLSRTTAAAETAAFPPENPMTSTPFPTLLRLDASARHEGSHSRQLGDRVESAWRARHAGGRVLRRDLAAEPLPHIGATTIAGYYTPPDQLTPALRDATALSDRLIAELQSADTLLITSPMYNFSVPSALKAWIDQVVRIGHTFAYEGGSFRGLVTRPRAVLALAYGAPGYVGGPFAAMDHLQPYLASLLGFLGIAQVDVVAVEATTADAGTVATQAAAAQRRIDAIAATFASAEPVTA
jgi:FMN-dependent NADH-azoreductase